MQEYRTTALDGLRGWAAFVVAIHHGIDHNLPGAHDAFMLHIFAEPSAQAVFQKLLLTTFNANLAVIIFFVLSGKVLFDSLLRSNYSTPSAFIGFSLKRIVRIYPALWVTLALYSLTYVIMHNAFLTEPGPPLNDVLINATLAQITMYGAAWTLTVEILVIPIILASVYLYRLYGSVAILLIASALILVFDTPTLSFIPYLPNYAFLFSFGFLASTAIGREIGGSIRNVSPWIIVAALVFLPIVIPYGLPSVRLFQGFLALMLIVRLASSESNGLKSLLDKPLSQFLGRISFSLYLLHPILLAILDHLAISISNSVGQTSCALIIGILTPTLTIPFAILMYRFVEEPTIRAGKAISEKLNARVFALNPA